MQDFFFWNFAKNADFWTYPHFFRRFLVTKITRKSLKINGFFSSNFKVQYFISPIKPFFKHFINIFDNSVKFVSTIRFCKSKKIFTFEYFTKFYVFVDFRHTAWRVPPAMGSEQWAMSKLRQKNGSTSLQTRDKRRFSGFRS